MISKLINRPCTLLLRTTDGEDRYGNDKVTETRVETVCAFQKQTTLGDSEDSSHNNLAESGWDLFLNIGHEINSGDGVIVDGRVYEIDGDPWLVMNELTGQISHIEATCRRVAGAGDGEGS